MAVLTKEEQNRILSEVWQQIMQSNQRSKPTALNRFNLRLTQCPRPGTGVHQWIMSCANLGVRACLPDQEIINSVESQIPKQRLQYGEVTEAVKKAHCVPYKRQGSRYRQPREKPAAAISGIVTRYPEATLDDIINLSPMSVRDMKPEVQRDSILDLYENMHVFCGERIGTQVKSASEWIGTAIGPYFCPNVFKGIQAESKNGKMSYRCDAAINWPAPFALVEFDEISLNQQAAVVLDMIQRQAGVAAAVYSGGKSIHLWIQVDAMSSDDWDQRIRPMYVEGGVFYRLGADPACQNPSRLSRLPGAARRDKDGVIQRLLFLDPVAFDFEAKAEREAIIWCDNPNINIPEECFG